jgi:hypothetical protein
MYFPLKSMAIHSSHPNGASALNNFQFYVYCLYYYLDFLHKYKIQEIKLIKINKDGRNKARDGGFKQVSAWILKPTKSH